MKQLRYILSLLFFFLGFFSENLQAEVITLENERTASFSEQNFKEASAEKEWLGLLYLQEKYTPTSARCAAERLLLAIKANGFTLSWF